MELVAYFIFVVVLALYYLFASMTTTVPWKYCDHAWNTELCQDERHVEWSANISQSGRLLDIAIKSILKLYSTMYSDKDGDFLRPHPQSFICCVSYFYTRYFYMNI